MIWKREDNGCIVLAGFNDCTLYKGLKLLPRVLAVLLQHQQPPLDAATVNGVPTRPCPPLFLHSSPTPGISHEKMTDKPAQKSSRALISARGQRTRWCWISTKSQAGGENLLMTHPRGHEKGRGFRILISLCSICLNALSLPRTYYMTLMFPEVMTSFCL